MIYFFELAFLVFAPLYRRLIETRVSYFMWIAKTILSIPTTCIIYLFIYYYYFIVQRLCFIYLITIIFLIICYYYFIIIIAFYFMLISRRQDRVYWVWFKNVWIYSHRRCSELYLEYNTHFSYILLRLKPFLWLSHHVLNISFMFFFHSPIMCLTFLLCFHLQMGCRVPWKFVYIYIYSRGKSNMIQKQKWSGFVGKTSCHFRLHGEGILKERTDENDN